MSNQKYNVAVLTASDKGAQGLREDKSGPLIMKLMTQNGYKVLETCLLPDDLEQIRNQLHSWANNEKIHLILTTGGTGLSPRDCTPEATLAVGEKLVPGISEAIRNFSIAITPRAMLSRGVSVITNNTLIINLPGSAKAVEECLTFLIPTLEHGLDTLFANTSDCART